MEDKVNHPSHYTDGKIEVIEYIEDKHFDYNLGNVCKYISRAGKKDPDKKIEDLRKAKWYLEREITELVNDTSDDNENNTCCATYSSFSVEFDNNQNYKTRIKDVSTDQSIASETNECLDALSDVADDEVVTSIDSSESKHAETLSFIANLAEKTLGIAKTLSEYTSITNVTKNRLKNLEKDFDEFVKKYTNDKIDIATNIAALDRELEKKKDKKSRKNK